MARCHPYVEGMSNTLQIAEVGALVGDPARANILCALLGGRALTATELAFAAGVSPQTTSGHLGKLLGAQLLVLTKQGRHRYYRLAGPHVGQMLESIMNVALTGPPRFQPKSKLDEDLRRARTCYDHIAGKLGVALYASFAGNRWFAIGPVRNGTACELSAHGRDGFAALGIDLEEALSLRRRFAYECLDWSERRPHLGGALAAALLRVMLQKNWVERDLDSRVLTITDYGQHELFKRLNIQL